MLAQAKTTVFLLLLFLLSDCLLSQELPGGEVRVWPALESEKGGHPRVVIQQVPEATTTATCLLLRYAEPGKQSPPPGTAHLFEHLLFRTEPAGKPGGLLLRDESLGSSGQAWVSPGLICFSEIVPSEEGLESLKLQLQRLRGVPSDKEGLMLEKRAIRSESIKGELPEEKGRRQILHELGLKAEVEGDPDLVEGLTSADLLNLARSLNLSTDVVISIVGPHSVREVRGVLSSTLGAMEPTRKEPRQPVAQDSEAAHIREIVSPSGHHQDSHFFTFNTDHPGVPVLAEEALKNFLPEGVEAQLVREEDHLFRLDISPGGTPLPSLDTDKVASLTTGSHDTLRRLWLQSYESPRARAIMLARQTLWGEAFHTPLSPEDINRLAPEVSKLLETAKDDSVLLKIRPEDPAASVPSLFPYKTKAQNNGGPSVSNEVLPNKLSVTLAPSNQWPTVGVAGYFRISPPLTPTQAIALEKVLNNREELRLQYEIRPRGLFFTAWAPADSLNKLLRSSARELQELSQSKENLLEGTDGEPGVVERFFLPTLDEGSPSKVSGKRIIDPKLGHLVVAGDIEQKDLQKGLRPAWSGWFSTSTPPPIRPSKETTPQSAGPENRTIELPQEEQPLLILGFSGPSRSSQDFLPFNLALQTLAGRPVSSVLNRRLKSVNSVKLLPLTVSSGATEEEEQVWLIALRLKSPLNDPSAVVKSVTKLLQKLGRTRMAEKELDRTRNFLKNSLILSASTAKGKARVLAHAEFHRLSRSYVQNFAGLYDHLEPQLVKSVCARYLSEPKVRWLYLRPNGKPEKDDEA